MYDKIHYNKKNNNIKKKKKLKKKEKSFNSIFWIYYNINPQSWMIVPKKKNNKKSHLWIWV